MTSPKKKRGEARKPDMCEERFRAKHKSYPGQTNTHTDSEILSFKSIASTLFALLIIQASEIFGGQSLPIVIIDSVMIMVAHKHLSPWRHLPSSSKRVEAHKSLPFKSPSDKVCVRREPSQDPFGFSSLKRKKNSIQKAPSLRHNSGPLFALESVNPSPFFEEGENS